MDNFGAGARAVATVSACGTAGACGDGDGEDGSGVAGGRGDECGGAGGLRARTGTLARPTPTVTALTPEEEAFRAAEATYRAYVDAVNARRRDPNSTPSPESFLTGAALADETRSAARLEELGVRLVGDTNVVRVTLDRLVGTSVYLTACLDGSATRLLNADGVDITPEGRQYTSALLVTVSRTSGRLQVSDSRAGSGTC